MEAASVDGAGPWHRLMHVTLPGISGTVYFTAVVNTITLTGYMTNNCIIASASDAEIHAFNTEVLSDATGAINISNSAGTVDAKTVHTTLMALLNSNFAAVASTDDWARAVETEQPLGKSNLVESAADGAAASLAR